MRVLTIGVFMPFLTATSYYTMASLTARSLILLENSALTFDEVVWGGEANITHFKAGVN
jgi:hypothetical protein